MIKARMVGKKFADETKKAELFTGTPGLSALRYLVSKLATNMCGEERKRVGVMDVKSAFWYGRARRHFFYRLSHSRPQEPIGRSVGKIRGIIVRDT